jgi:hypothetical protein
MWLDSILNDGGKITPIPQISMVTNFNPPVSHCELFLEMFSNFLKSVIYFYNPEEDNYYFWNMFMARSYSFVKHTEAVRRWSKVVLQVTPAVVYLLLEGSITNLSHSSSSLQSNSSVQEGHSELDSLSEEDSLEDVKIENSRPHSVGKSKGMPLMGDSSLGLLVESGSINSSYLESLVVEVPWCDRNFV